MGAQSHCLNCGCVLNRRAPVCPACGTAQPVRPLGGVVGLVILIAGLLIATAVAVLIP